MKLTPKVIQGFTKKHWWLILLILLSVQEIQAKDKYNVTINVAPSLEWLHFRNDITGLNDLFGNKPSYNFGVEYLRYLDPSFSLSVGLQFQNKGFRNVSEFPVAGSDEIKEGITIVAARYVMLPVAANFHIPVGRRKYLILSGGLSTGYMAIQTIWGRNFDDAPPSSNPFISFENGRSNIDIFKRTYLGFNLGIGYSVHVKSRVVFTVQPTYSNQLNNAISPDFRATQLVNARLNSFSIEFKLGYYFTDQIKNRKKEF